jgi:uncharacterized protein YdeI (YjbR/CyaY-like superfamily)
MTTARSIAPSDVKAALAASAGASAVWKNLSPSCRAEWMKWIEEAKKPETRARRIAVTVESVAAGWHRSTKTRDV